MDRTRHLIISVVLSILIIIIGTVGYMLIENWGILDALYMTVITISTVGYREVHDVGALGRIFSIFLIFSGVGFTLYVAAAVVQFMVEGRIRIIMGRRRLDKKIDRLKSHYIVCGYGRIGRVLCRNLRRTPLDVVVVEKNPAQIPVMDQDGMLYVNGEATEETNLIKAGIQRAKVLVAALGTDTDNVFLVLTAKQLAPGLTIIRQNYNLIIIAIKKPDGSMLFNPSFEAVIKPDDTVIAVGEVDNLQKLEQILNPRKVVHA